MDTTTGQAGETATTIELAGTATLHTNQFLAVASVGEAAAKGNVTPVIETVRITRTGDQFRAVATDRYRLAVLEFELTHPAQTDGDLDILIRADQLKKLAAPVKSSKAREVSFTVVDNVAVIGYDSASVTLTGVKGNYPPIEKLLPELTDEPATVAPIGLKPEFLATMTKFIDPTTGKKFDVWRAHFETTNESGRVKPVCWVAGSFRYLIQPNMLR